MTHYHGNPWHYPQLAGFSLSRAAKNLARYATPISQVLTGNVRGAADTLVTSTVQRYLMPAGPAAPALPAGPAAPAPPPTVVVPGAAGQHGGTGITFVGRRGRKGGSDWTVPMVVAGGALLLWFALRR